MLFYLYKLIPICFFIYIIVYPFVFLFEYITACLPFCLNIFLNFCLNACLFVCLSAQMLVWTDACLLVCPNRSLLICPNTRLLICVFAEMFVYLQAETGSTAAGWGRGSCTRGGKRGYRSPHATDKKRHGSDKKLRRQAQNLAQPRWTKEIYKQANI